MKEYGGVDVEIHIFLTSALIGGEWSVSHPGRFTPGKDYPVQLYGKLVGPQSLCGRRGEEKILDPTVTRTSDLSVIQPVYDIPAPIT
jgi:hypothetical protein